MKEKKCKPKECFKKIEEKRKQKRIIKKKKVSQGKGKITETEKRLRKRNLTNEPKRQDPEAHNLESHACCLTLISSLLRVSSLMIGSLFLNLVDDFLVVSCLMVLSLLS